MPAAGSSRGAGVEWIDLRDALEVGSIGVGDRFDMGNVGQEGNKNFILGLKTIDWALGLPCAG